MRTRKVWDITPARDEWERWYAHMEYLRIGIHRILATHITVQEYKLGDYFDAEPWELV